MTTLLAYLWQIEPIGLTILTVCILTLIIYPFRYKIRYLIGGAWLLALWAVANVLHYLKTPEVNRSEIRKLKYKIACAELIKGKQFGLNRWEAK